MLAEQFEVGGGHVAESVLVGQFLVAFLKLVFGERMRWRNFTGDFTGQLYQHGHVGFGIFLTLSQLAFTSGSGGVFFLLLLELGMEIGQLALQRDDFGGFIIDASFLVPSAWRYRETPEPEYSRSRSRANRERRVPGAARGDTY